MRNSAFAACARDCAAAVHTRLTIGSDGTARRARRGGNKGGRRCVSVVEGWRKMRREMKGNKFPRPDQEFGGWVGWGRDTGGLPNCVSRLDDDISA